MNEFFFYLKQGIHHITDFNGFDHMLFVMCLCAVYRLEEWKRVLILVTAFTIGHSITLALTALNVIAVNRNLIEALIPLTILSTCVFNIIKQGKDNSRISLNYILALFFGLIHGMGFSNFFKTMMIGISDNIVFPLMSFNIGIEIGQIIIIATFMLALFLFTHVLKVPHKIWMFFISISGGIMAIYLFVEAIKSSL